MDSPVDEMTTRQMFPKPLCPECKSEMRLVEPRKGQDWDAFWGCPKYPKCRGTRNIDPDTGKPETDYERDERRREYYDDMIGVDPF